MAPTTEAGRIAAEAAGWVCSLAYETHTHNGPCPDSLAHYIVAVESEARAKALDDVRREVEEMPEMAGEAYSDGWSLIQRRAVLAALDRLAAPAAEREA